MKRRDAFEIILDEGLSLEEIKEKLLFHKEEGMIAYAVINGIRVYNDQENVIESELRMAKYGLNKEGIKQIQTMENDAETLFEIFTNCSSVDKGTEYFINLGKKYVKSELQYEYLKYVYKFCNKPRYKDSIRISSYIMLALEEENELKRYKELGSVFEGVKTDEDSPVFIVAAGIVSKYAKKANLFGEIYDNEKEVNCFKTSIEEEIKSLDLQLKKYAK